jgi:phenylpyruvate tautomerase
MPLFKLITNQSIENQDDFLKSASKTIAEILGKSEKYVMVILQSDLNMIFSGSSEPAMFIELKSIGLPKDKTGQISRKIMEFIQSETGVRPDRIFIEFADVHRELWGWNSDTI